jgi:glycosyltransferase involved in cell wall biosynthesis
VPIVSNVGDLSDVIATGVDGFLISPDAAAAFGARAVELLTQPAVWDAYSRAAARKAHSCCGIDVIAQRWREALSGFVATHAAEGKGRELA